MDPNNTSGSQTIPLDDREGGVLVYTYQPGGGTGHHEIQVMNADGTGRRRLTDNSVGDFSPRWSPDGTRIAFGSDATGSQHGRST